LQKSFMSIACILCIIIASASRGLIGKTVQCGTRDLQGTNVIEYDIMLHCFFARDMENKNEKIEEAKACAFDLYVKDQFACSEAILYTIHRILGSPLPIEIIRLASGFAGGIGKSGSICGSLNGGVMALGLAFGRSEAGASCPKLFPATRELLEWFDLAFGSSCCAELTKKKSTFGRKEPNRCAIMTGETAAKTMELILKYEKMSSPRVLLQRVRQTLRTI